MDRRLWSQGSLLYTEVTRRFSKDLWESESFFERKRVYENFTMKDGGRSRKLVAICQTPEQAALIVEAVNHFNATKIQQVG